MAGLKRVTRVPALPPLPVDAHKGSQGTVLVVAGSHAMLGAAVLAAQAAQRGGAGLVRVALPRPLQPLLPLAVPTATTVERRGAAFRAAVAGADAVVAGPGLGAGPATARLVAALLRAAVAPVVLDADALNVLAPWRRPLPVAAALVLTPHPGEAARLLGSTAAAVQADRRGALAALCARTGAVVVLKGPGTLVGDGRRWFQNRTGNPGLATAGAGDVLAGLCGAFLAQGLPPFDAACAAVAVHGRAGDRCAAQRGARGLLASDLPVALAEVLR